MKTREFTGKTTQDAINQGLQELGVTIADVHVEVLQEGAKGLFGLFGSKPAKVRLTVNEEEKEEDDGLSDLLGSFSLDSNSKKQKQEKKNPPKAQQKEEAPLEEKKEEKSRTEKPREESRDEKPKSEKPKAEKPKTDKPKENVQPKPQTEKKAEAKAEPNSQASETDKGAEAPKQQERKPKPPRERKPERKPDAEKAQVQADGAKPSGPMEKTEPFAPEGPAELYAEDTPAGKAQHFLIELTSRMNLNVQVYVQKVSDEAITLHILGDTVGVLIGRRGETLDAVQYLTSLQVNKGREGYIRVTVDSENYRAKREDSLRRLAIRMANRAQKTGRRVVLEPMNPYERRVLHTALQNHPAVTTHSEGEEPNRRVVISLKSQQPAVADAETEKKASGESRNRKRSRGRRRPPKKGPQASQENTESSEGVEMPELAEPAAEHEPAVEQQSENE